MKKINKRTNCHVLYTFLYVKTLKYNNLDQYIEIQNSWSCQKPVLVYTITLLFYKGLYCIFQKLEVYHSIVGKKKSTKHLFSLSFIYNLNVNLTLP